MNDLVDRQAAIDAYGDWYVEEGPEEGFIGTVKQLLEGLPSAQPGYKKCRNCKYYAVDSDIGYAYCHAWRRGTKADWHCSRGE